MARYDEAFEDAEHERPRRRAERAYDEDDDRRDDDRPISRPRHSGLGVASFILSLVSGVALVASILIAGIIGLNHDPAAPQDRSELMVIGFAVIGAAALALVGAALGLAGILQTDRKLVFAVLGLIFNVLIILAFCGVLGVGLAMG
jgi:hypothetical protein